MLRHYDYMTVGQVSAARFLVKSVMVWALVEVTILLDIRLSIRLHLTPKWM
jgi:hypothetical protein